MSGQLMDMGTCAAGRYLHAAWYVRHLTSRAVARMRLERVPRCVKLQTLCERRILFMDTLHEAHT